MQERLDLGERGVFVQSAFVKLDPMDRLVASPEVSRGPTPLPKGDAIWGRSDMEPTVRKMKIGFGLTLNEEAYQGYQEKLQAMLSQDPRYSELIEKSKSALLQPEDEMDPMTIPEDVRIQTTGAVEDIDSEGIVMKEPLGASNDVNALKKVHFVDDKQMENSATRSSSETSTLVKISSKARRLLASKTKKAVECDRVVLSESENSCDESEAELMKAPGTFSFDESFLSEERLKRKNLRGTVRIVSKPLPGERDFHVSGTSYGSTSPSHRESSLDESRVDTIPGLRRAECLGDSVSEDIAYRANAVQPMDRKAVAVALLSKDDVYVAPERDTLILTSDNPLVSKVDHRDHRAVSSKCTQTQRACGNVGCQTRDTDHLSGKFSF